MHPTTKPKGAREYTLCSHCKKPICFYRGPQGGEGFFNLWGPPWPPHPCQAGQRLRDIVRQHQSLPKPRAVVSRMLVQGIWSALNDSHIKAVNTADHPHRAEAQVHLIEGQAFGRDWRFYTPAALLSERAPCFVLEMRGQLFFSTLVENKGRAHPWTVQVYATLEELYAAPVSDPPRRAKPKRPPAPGQHELDRMWNLAMRQTHTTAVSHRT